MEDQISIIIPTVNEEKVIETLLKSIKNQSYNKFEIIIVDKNSTDKTKQICQKYTKLIFNKGPERSAQRNFGVSKSKGRYVLILDADMSLQKNVLKECIEIIERDDFGALIIPEKSFGVGYWAKCKAFEREFYLGDEDIEAARFFKKELFNKFGGYDTRMTGPEDVDLPLRMKKDGIKIGRIKSFILHNEKKYSPIKSAKKKFYYASHSLAHLKRHPEKAFTQGNLLFRPSFFRQWKKLIANPTLSIGMIVMRLIEMIGALIGICFALVANFFRSNYNHDRA